MKWIFYIVLTSLIVILGTVIFRPSGTLKLNHKSQNSQTVMTITSSAFANNATIPSKYTCDGDNVNPPLTFSGVPKEAKSLVLLVEDPDAPGGTYHHWSVYNIPPTTSGIAENSKPAGSEGITDFGTAQYGGPCPPNGSHHYHFKLYALDTMLELSSKATFNEIQNAMTNHAISSSELIGLYSRSK
jgi:Raf kinase inhibitor-like YbhB/YbcL family protein